MSHFTVLVLLDNGSDIDFDSITNAISEKLAPYDENLDVEPYDEKCWCVNAEASQYANEQANKLMTWDDLRSSFSRKHPEASGKERQSLWKEHIQPYLDYLELLEKSHEMHQKARHNCEECNGTGIRQTTYNPKSKWDWYSIGGRWDGDLVNYTEIKSPNMAYCHELIGKYRPFAILSPLGWHKKGDMGWWAIVTNEDENWHQAADKILELYKDHIAVLVDCHI